MNSYIREFLTTIDARYSDDTSTTTMAEWIVKNTRLRRRPFSFKDFEFQERIISDMHPDLSCKKCSQIGLTESQIRKYLAFLRRNVGTTGIYTMPNDIMRDRVSQTRVKPLIDTEPVFNPPTVDKPVRQKGLYQIEDSFAYFTGSTEGDATSIPADMLFHDELDLTDQSMIGLFQSRLQMSKHKIRQQFSTPTFHGYGIDAAYSASDQFEYFTRCPSCRQHQLPEFHPKFIGGLPAHTNIPDDLTSLSIEQIQTLPYGDLFWRCEKCSSPLDLGDPTVREWVAKYPGRNARGYNVRPTSVDSITLPYIFTQLGRFIQAENLKGFHNTVLGEAFNDSNARLGEAEILACMRSREEPTDITQGTPCFVGVDAGLICHVVLGVENRTILWAQVKRDELQGYIEGLFRRFNIIGGCMDRYPYTPTAEAVRDIEDHKGVIMPVAYATTPKAPPLHANKDEFDDITHWTANRTQALDKAAGVIRKQQMTIEGFGPHRSLITSHLRDMVRIETPDTPPIWNKISGEDHFFHAFSYMLLSQRLVQAINFKSDKEERSHFLLLGGQSIQSADLSPRSLNRNLGQYSIRNF